MIKDNSYIPRKRLYTVKEAALYLGHTVWGVRSLIWSKTLPVVQHGRKQFVDLFDLEAFIEKHKSQGRQ
jgi:excisionase family DNA binding protein